MISAALQLFFAYVYGHVLEYILHIVLHRYGRKKNSPMAFHWKDHHKHARRQLMHDTPSFRECCLVALLTLLHLPVLFVFPWFYLGLVASSCSYLYHHWRAHLDPEWAYEHVPWHIEHHLGYQHASWGVRSNWVDKLAGTMDWKLPENKDHDCRKNRNLARWLQVSGQGDWSPDDYERRNVRPKK